MRKLFFNVATGCSLAVASGVAMAVDCAEGFIIGEQVDEITIDGEPCHIEDVVVEGNVTITNSPAISMIDVEVEGSVSLTGATDGTSRASLTRVDAFSGNFDVNDHGAAIVSACITRDGNMTVNDNTAAIVYSNIVIGDLTCTGNQELDSFFNTVSGTDNCVEAAPPQNPPAQQDPPPPAQNPPAQQDSSSSSLTS